MSAAWDSEKDLAWDRAETLADVGRGAPLPLFDFLTRSPYWRGLPLGRRRAFLVESFDWALCQMIHGETLALETARAVAASRAPAAIRAAAAAMAEEESRHRRAFLLYRERVLGRRGRLDADWCPALKKLIASQTRWDRKLLALQVVGERLFLETLRQLRAAGPGPVLRRLAGLVMRDERGHCLQGAAARRAAGRGEEQARFVFDVCRAMIGEFPAAVCVRSGLDAAACLRAYRRQPRTGRGGSLSRLLRGLPRGIVSRRLRPAYAALELV